MHTLLMVVSSEVIAEAAFVVAAVFASIDFVCLPVSQTKTNARIPIEPNRSIIVAMSINLPQRVACAH